jgi:hypothetical protein
MTARDTAPRDQGYRTLAQRTRATLTAGAITLAGRRENYCSRTNDDLDKNTKATLGASDVYRRGLYNGVAMALEWQPARQLDGHDG